MLVRYNQNTDKDYVRNYLPQKLTGNPRSKGNYFIMVHIHVTKSYKFSRFHSKLCQPVSKRFLLYYPEEINSINELETIIFNPNQDDTYEYSRPQLFLS